MRDRAIVDAIARELEQAVEWVTSGAAPTSATLARSLQRDLHAVLERHRRAGHLTAFALRCTPVRHADGRAGVAVEVGLRLPGRVQQVVLRLGALG